MAISEQWVVLELSSRGETEDPDTLKQAINRTLKGAEIFIPASVSNVGDSRVVHRLVDGYIFVKRTFPDGMYHRLEQTKYINSVLTTVVLVNGRAARKLACIGPSEILKMRGQIHIEADAGIRVGDQVQVTSGAYRGINGEVIEELAENDTVQVFIKLRSKQAIVTLPRSFLKFVAKDPEGETPTFSPFSTKISRLREWIRLSRPILAWPSDAIQEVNRKGKLVFQFDHWVRLANSAMFALSPVKVFDLSRLTQAKEKTLTLDHWVRKGEELFYQARLAAYEHLPQGFEEKNSKATWLHNAVTKLTDLTSDVDSLERSLSANTPDMIENILVDGHNLAYRVFHASNVFSGGSELTDAQGRPTSIVFGVLKSLGSIQKRFPEASLHVVWDGSPQRRKGMYPLYKANRPVRAVGPEGEQGFSQIDYLRKVLPALGVAQSYNPEEETDDIIACLVRGPLKGHRNVIVSTDHDFVQLVTDTDIVLNPKVGSRAEALYDKEKVLTEYGVPPEKVVQLRALMGSADTSDNLKGVPRVPTKVLLALLTTHGSVDAIYKSNLAGVTANQFDKIRAAEKQVRLNVELMTLLTDLPYTTYPATYDLEEATRLLDDVNIQTEPILKAFPKKASGFFKHS